MSYLVIKKSTLRALITAARNIQQLLDDGVISAAFGAGGDDQVHTTISAFDQLTASAINAAGQDKITSPFLRYRREILGHYDTASRLRALVLNLWGGRPANLSQLFSGADEHHTRIALEMIASYSQYGENDTFFMGIAMEIAEAIQAQEQQAEEVAA